MKTLNVYLTFAGNCEEALNFYKDCLGGDFTFQRFGEAPMPSSEEQKNKIMHAEFRSGDVYFMASDAMENMTINGGDNITLSLNFSEEKEQAAIFEKLSAGGTVTMPLQDTFWGAKFGMFMDKFGINWMSNCDKK